MFSGTVESKSHEGGLLVHFDGSSPALNAIMIRSDDGSYIGKVDGVIGSTGHPLAHIAHIDRSLDMDALIGVTVSVRPKKPREERSDRRGDDRRQGGRDNRGFRNDRNGDDRRQGGRDNRGFRNDRSGDDRRQGGRDNRGFRSGGGQRDGGGQSNNRSSGGSWQRNGRPQRSSSDNDFRRAKGKRSGHAHNRPPRDFRSPRKFERKDE